MTKDMTVGKPLPLILSFSIPLLLGNIFQQLYNLVDTIIVGRYLGITALTSVGATASINFLIVGFTTGVCAGFAIPIAQKFGARDYSYMRRLVANSAYQAAAIGLILTVITVIYCREILLLMQTPAGIVDGSYGYLVVIFAGMPFTILYNMTAGIIRAMGDSKTPFYFLAVATVLNILLDLIFIVVFQTGVAGAAYATVIAQAFSAVLCLLYMRKKYPQLRLEAGEGRISKECQLSLAAIGIPMGLQTSITGIGTVMLQSSVNRLGIVYVSAYTAVMKIKQFTIGPYSAFDTAVATYTSQNFGAGKNDRVYQGMKAGLVIYGVYSVAMAVILTLASDKIALIFVKPSETEVLAGVSLFFRCCGVFYLVIMVLNCFRAIIQGMGYGVASMLAGLCELVSRAGMALFLIPQFGYIAVCFTDAAAWCTAGICVAVMYYFIMRKMNKTATVL